MIATNITPDDLDYPLPESSIATRPASPRDSARMMVVRCSSEGVEHVHVRDLPGYLEAGDLMVFNDTQVIPARLVGQRVDTGGRVEGLFLGGASAGHGGTSSHHRWTAMLKSNGRLRAGMAIELLDHAGEPGGFEFTPVEKVEDAWHVKSSDDPMGALMRLGRTPLPPYILRSREQRHEDGIDDDDDRAWYQTIYADEGHRGSVAAPTAGLHFTPELLDRITATGVQQARVTLHVGPGTFKPVTAATLAAHPMHREWYDVGGAAIDAIQSQKQRRGSRLIAVGTTTVRTLESLPTNLNALSDVEMRGQTELLIAPPYEFRHVDGMLTNFHLPRSTLLALVAAKVGLDRLKALYAEAVERRYRFYSYGDAMLILP